MRTSLTGPVFSCRRSFSPTAGSLIKKALDIDELPSEITDMKVTFPWFPVILNPDEMNACDAFISKLCEMTRNQKRFSASERSTDNEKYAFRCFLLRLGFIDAEYKTARKIPLRNLPGNRGVVRRDPLHTRKGVERKSKNFSDTMLSFLILQVLSSEFTL